MAKPPLARKKHAVTHSERMADLAAGFKVCSKCRIKKEVGNFSQSKKAKTGISSRCKECEAIYSSEYYDRIKKSGEKRKSYYRYRPPTEETRAADRERRLKNLEASRNRERLVKIKRRTLDKKIGGGSRRAVRELMKDVARLLVLQDGKCAALHCRTDITKKNHVDHIIPLYFAGTNEPCNLQLLCPDCNLAKGKKHPNDWMPTMWWRFENTSRQCDTV